MMKPIVVAPSYDNLDIPHYDTLDGSTLDNGQMLHIQWPDGTMTTEPITIDRILPPFLLNGRLFQAYDDRAYVPRVINGASIRVYLRWNNFLAERV